MLGVLIPKTVLYGEPPTLVLFHSFRVTTFVVYFIPPRRSDLVMLPRHPMYIRMDHLGTNLIYISEKKSLCRSDMPHPDKLRGPLHRDVVVMVVLRGTVHLTLHRNRNSDWLMCESFWLSRMQIKKTMRICLVFTDSPHLPSHLFGLPENPDLDCCEEWNCNGNFYILFAGSPSR
jgi:hypothetical protein